MDNKIKIFEDKRIRTAWNEETYRLCGIMLRDSAYIQEQEAACQGLKTIAELSKGLTNKEPAAFTDQIKGLCDKYARKSRLK